MKGREARRHLHEGFEGAAQEVAPRRVDEGRICALRGTMLTRTNSLRDARAGAATRSPRCRRTAARDAT